MKCELIQRIRETFLNEDGKPSRTYLFRPPSGRGVYSRNYITMRIARLVQRIMGREHFSAHSFRHTFAPNALRKHGTGRIKAIQGALGHSSSSTTINLYCHDEFTWDEDQEPFQ